MTLRENMIEWERFHPYYRVWHTMMQNCGLSAGTSEKARKYYEARGITVCEDWRDYNKFEAWMRGTRWQPRKRMAHVRKDKFKDFSPENCVVTSCAEAQNLRSNCVRVKGMTIRDFLGAGVDEMIEFRKAVKNRITACGWDEETAVSTELNKENTYRSHGESFRKEGIKVVRKDYGHKLKRKCSECGKLISDRSKTGMCASCRIRKLNKKEVIMKAIVAALALSALVCGCSGLCEKFGSDPIVSPDRVSTQGGDGEVQIPHYVPTWYE